MPCSSGHVPVGRLPGKFLLAAEAKPLIVHAAADTVTDNPPTAPTPRPLQAAAGYPPGGQLAVAAITAQPAAAASRAMLITR